MKTKINKGAEEYFSEGILYAAAMLYRLHGQSSMAADVLREAGLEVWDCSGLDEFEKESLRAINNEKGIALTGL